MTKEEWNTDKKYDAFVRGGLSVGFSDDQVDFLVMWIDEILEINDDKN